MDKESGIREHKITDSSIPKIMEPKAYKVPHEELCDQALEHYNQISTEAMCWNSLIPEAIEFYKKNCREGMPETVPGSPSSEVGGNRCNSEKLPPRRDIDPFVELDKILDMKWIWLSSKPLHRLLKWEEEWRPKMREGLEAVELLEIYKRTYKRIVEYAVELEDKVKAVKSLYDEYKERKVDAFEYYVMQELKEILEEEGKDFDPTKPDKGAHRVILPKG